MPEGHVIWKGLSNSFAAEFISVSEIVFTAADIAYK